MANETQEKKRRQSDQRRYRNDDIQRALERAFPSAQRLALHRHREMLAEATFLLLTKNVANLLVRIQPHRQRRNAQQAADLGKRAVAAPWHDQRELQGLKFARGFDRLRDPSAVPFAQSSRIAALEPPRRAIRAISSIPNCKKSDSPSLSNSTASPSVTTRRPLTAPRRTPERAAAPTKQAADRRQTKRKRRKNNHCAARIFRADLQQEQNADHSELADRQRHRDSGQIERPAPTEPEVGRVPRTRGRTGQTKRPTSTRCRPLRRARQTRFVA